LLVATKIYFDTSLSQPHYKEVGWLFGISNIEELIIGGVTGRVVSDLYAVNHWLPSLIFSQHLLVPSLLSVCPPVRAPILWDQLG
jgi:hypothetical protein